MTRRRGQVAEPRVTCAGRRWRTRRRHATDSHETTWVHVGARVGRHMAGKDGRRRAHGHSGTLVREGAVTQLMDNCAPLFKRNFSHYFLCGTMSHTILTFCRQRGRTTGIRFGQDGGDRVDPSPRDHQSNTWV